MIIACTGHRPDKLGGYSRAAFQTLARAAVLYLEENTPDALISGGALGWDQACAAAAIVLKIPLVVVVPFPGQDTMWPSESRDQYRAILSAASRVHYVSQGGYQPWKMHKRNHWMVDNCDHMLVMFNGTPGGTAQCLDYAKRKRKTFDNLWDEFQAARVPQCG